MIADRIRPTTRRWIVAIAIAACFLGACRWAEGWRLTFLHRSRLAEFERTRELFEEGRVTCDRPILSSRRLMKARLDLERSRRSRIETIQAHLKRVDLILERERKDLETIVCCRGGGMVDLVEGEQLRAEDAELLAREEGRASAEAAPGSY